MRKVRVADLLCGAGGSSTGAVRALEPQGFDVELYCLNHWELALETHRRNHPNARHICLPIEHARPTEHVPSGHLDLLMASPTCTHHSRARGGRPTSDQQRADPWQVLQWLTELRVDRVMIENVWEFVDWGPVDPRTGRPIKSRKGEYFRAWLGALDACGMALEFRKINFANFGDPTTRERFVGMARHRRLRSRITWPEATHARRPTGELHRWVPARVCIDWTIRGASIYARDRPLSAKTILRIHAGVTKFDWPERYVRRLEHYMLMRGIEIPARRRATSQGSLAFIDVARNNAHGVSCDEPLRTIAAGGTHHALVAPFILAQGEGSEGRPVDQPMPTIPCGGAHALIAPYYGSGSGTTAQSIDRPLPAITTLARFGLIVPVMHGGGFDRVHSLERPFPTITTANRGELAFITSSMGERDGQLPRVHSLEEPMPAVLASGYKPLAQAAEDDDLLYRMLQPPELARAMSFSSPKWGEYQFAGNKTQVTKQIGNGVPSEGWQAHVAALCSDLVR
ncbi:DNA cytosine methyltransferase [Reyranella sp.]|uniref:DNA cytosine methyltransferase n=1 Tax=Reyranella sp. TaxID=1929291 RepID=UPI003D13DCDF